MHSKPINVITTASAKSGKHATINVARKDLSFVALHLQYRAYIAALLGASPPPDSLLLATLDLPDLFLAIFPPKQTSTYLPIDIINRCLPLLPVRVPPLPHTTTAATIKLLLNHYVSCSILVSPTGPSMTATLPTTLPATLTPGMLASHLAHTLPQSYSLTLPAMPSLTASILSTRTAIVRAVNRSNFKEISRQETAKKHGEVAVTDAIKAKIVKERVVAGLRDVLCHV